MPESLELYVPNELGRGLQRFELRFDGDQFAGPDFRIRYGRDWQDAPVAQKIAHNGRDAYQLLQREVRIGRILVQRIGKNEYPLCLSRLIGYNPGTAENMGPLPPYSVFTYQRKTLADLADELPLRPELFRPIADGLIIALCYLQAAQVVHRRIRMETVRWDGTTVQLADFTHAAAEWDATPGAVGEVPWDSPEQRAGAAAADCRDDSYAVALLLARLATGQEFVDDEEAREAIARMDLTQQHLLRDAVAEYRRDRPTAYELRKRRKLPDPLNPVLRGSRGRESEARARFAALRQRQRSALQARREPRSRMAAAGAEGFDWSAKVGRSAGSAVGRRGFTGADEGREATPSAPSYPPRTPSSTSGSSTSRSPGWPSLISSSPARRRPPRSAFTYTAATCAALVIVLVIVLLLA